MNTEVGDTYPFEQVAGWLEEAGFVNARELPSPGPAPLILANRRWEGERRQNSGVAGVQELQNEASDFKSVTRNWKLSHFIHLL